MTTIVTRMQEIVLEINASLGNIQSESIKVGNLLNEANEEMKGNGLKSADFLKWCKDEFCIGKAQAYKLMKVATFFKDDKRFHGVSMRVLYTLATEATDSELEKAAEFAATSSLTTAVVNQLLNPEPVAPTKPEPSKKETQAEAEEKQEEIEKALANVQERHDFDMGDVPFDTDENKPSEVIKEADTSGLQAEITELRKALTAANELISNLRAEKVQHNVSKTMPMLPQFKNACPYAVLGLGQLEAKEKAKVNKAFRELVKLGYGKGHEAFELLEKAKKQLLEDIEG